MEDIGGDETVAILETISIWVITQEPFSINHYGRGEEIKILRGSAIGGGIVLPLIIFVRAEIVL